MGDKGSILRLTNSGAMVHWATYPIFPKTEAVYNTFNNVMSTSFMSFVAVGSSLMSDYWGWRWKNPYFM